MEAALPHHDGSPLYVANQTPQVGDHVGVRLRVPSSYGPVTRVHIRSLRDTEPHYDAAVVVGWDACWQWWEASVEVTNPVTPYRFLLEKPSGAGGVDWCWLNAEGLFSRDVPDAQDFRLVAWEPAPEWVHRSIVYQVFPDRFARSAAADQRPVPDWAIACDWNTTPVQPTGLETPLQYYGGDIDGITEKLDHIQGLGTTVLYLTPTFPARSNHRYDAATFEGVDDLLGGDEALIRLVAAAHARGLKVIGDLTTNHSGDAHEWFRSAFGRPESAESDFYFFSEANTRYTAWLGVPSLPKFNWNSAELRRRFITGEDSVVVRWLLPPYNLDGWRIDVANMTGRHGTDDLNREVANLVCQSMQRVKPDVMLLAESTSDAARDFTGENWQGAMTYSNFTRPLWQWLTRDNAPVNFFGTPLPAPNRIGAETFLETHRAFAAGFSWRVRTQNMNAINTHDTARAATVMIDGGQLVAAGLMFTLPGIPMVFAGDEFGLEGINGEGSRTPMPWHDPARIVTDLRRPYAELARLRRRFAALTSGSIRWLHAKGDVMVFLREHNDASLLVVAARAPFSNIRIPAGLVGEIDSAADLLFASADVTLTVNGTVPDGDRDVILGGQGPVVALWHLPGVRVPYIDATGV